jgi:uncharacterized membrane protein
LLLAGFRGTFLLEVVAFTLGRSLLVALILDRSLLLALGIPTRIVNTKVESVRVLMGQRSTVTVFSLAFA